MSTAATTVSSSVTVHRMPGRFMSLALVGAGAAIRLELAARNFLNPDEALHYFISAQPSFWLTYKASLTTAHPPLMFLLLHGWMKLGTSEFLLRLPFVAAGVLFCWLLFLWVREVAGENAAALALALALFSPSLISLSAEVRQYSLMLLGCAACLYFLERSLQSDSWMQMAWSAVSLWLALLTHYSALIFAATAGIYALARLVTSRTGTKTRVAWVLGQLVALGICTILFVTQISRLRSSGLPSEIASTWLRTSIFHPGGDHALSFAASKTVRLFRYFFSHGTIGVLLLALFCVAVIALFRGAGEKVSRRVSRPVAVLLVLPFLLMLATAFAGVYPYGGTRHDVVLELFALAGIAIAVDQINFPLLRQFPAKLLILIVLLVICNVFAAPTGPFIRPRNQSRKLMAEAVSALRSQPQASTVLTDYQSGLVLGYYLCGKHAGLPFGPTPTRILEARCNDDRLLTLVGSQGGFELQQLPMAVKLAWNTVPTASSLWLFQTGWIEDQGSAWNDELRYSGCEETRNFGANIRVCKINRPSAP
ncbi:MAG TPA: glycosyltransferase family 39 protein [Terriglobales bacterium]